jgi:hypothetical protein
MPYLPRLSTPHVPTSLPALSEAAKLHQLLLQHGPKNAKLLQQGAQLKAELEQQVTHQISPQVSEFLEKRIKDTFNYS